MAVSHYVGNERFPTDSVLRRVHGSVAVGFVYGQVAMLLAATKPDALKHFLGNSAWVAESASTRWLLLVERLAGAALAMDAVILGADEEAEQVSRRVRRAHERVNASTPMAAWVLMCIAFAEEEVHARLVRRFDAAEKESYWAGWRGFGELIGLAPSELPESYAEYRAAVARGLKSASIAVEDRELALDTCLRVPGLPVPRRYKPLMPFVRLAIGELLPSRVRGLYELRSRGWHRRVMSAAAAMSRLAHRVLPERWPSLVDFEGLARVARQRRAAIGAG